MVRLGVVVRLEKEVTVQHAVAGYSSVDASPASINQGSELRPASRGASTATTDAHCAGFICAPPCQPLHTWITHTLGVPPYLSKSAVMSSNSILWAEALHPSMPLPQPTKVPAQLPATSINHKCTTQVPHLSPLKPRSSTEPSSDCSAAVSRLRWQLRSRSLTSEV